MLLMTEGVYNVLFLCTGNSARSIIAESLLNAMGHGRFHAFSAGSHPSGIVNPLVVDYLDSVGVSTRNARSKSWDEFAGPGAPRMDLVVTVCDQAAGEACPIWPGAPARAHWAAPDPAAYMKEPDAAKRVIREVAQLMQRRISLLIAMLPATVDRMSLQTKAREIAQQVPARAADPA